MQLVLTILVAFGVSLFSTLHAWAICGRLNVFHFDSVCIEYIPLKSQHLQFLEAQDIL